MSVIYTSGGASVNDATTTVSGKVRLATIAEAGGTSESIAVTPAGLQAEISGMVSGTQYKGAVAFDAIATTLANASVGDMYRLSSSGSAHGYDWTIGDLIIVNADMGGTFDANKINRFDTTDADLATVATSGSYNDLLNQPSIPSASTDLTDTASLVRTTDLATVATTGSYNDLLNQPSIPSASTDLTDTASLVRTTDLATVATSGSYNDLLNQPSIPSASTDLTDTASLVRTTDLATVATSGSYNDLLNQPSIPSASTDLTDTASLVRTTDTASTTSAGIVELATIAEAGGTSEALAVTPAGLQAELASVVSGTAYKGAVAYDAISTTLVNASVGDMYRLSSSGSAHGYDWTIGDLIIVNADMGGTFDANKINRFDTTDADLATVATTGSYNDLLNQPSIPSASTDLTDTASLVRTTDLATVATTGSYNDLLNQPSIPSASTDLTDTASLVRTTDLATVATSGDYNDLINTPSSSAIAVATLNTTNNINASVNTAYYSLNPQANDNTFTLPDMANLSDGDVIIITRRNAGDIIIRGFDYQAGTPTQLIDYFGSNTSTRTITCYNQQIYIRYESASPKWYVFDKAQSLVATTGSYNDLLNQPSIPSASTDLTDTASLVRTTDLATVATTGSYNDLLNQPSIPSASTDLTDTASLVRTTDLATVATSGDYNDLINTPSSSGADFTAVTADIARTNFAVTNYYTVLEESTQHSIYLPNYFEGDALGDFQNKRITVDNQGETTVRVLLRISGTTANRLYASYEDFGTTSFNDNTVIVGSATYAYIDIPSFTTYKLTCKEHATVSYWFVEPFSMQFDNFNPQNRDILVYNSTTEKYENSSDRSELTYSFQNSNFTAQVGYYYYVDSSAGNITVSLSEDATVVGNRFKIFKAKSANSVIIAESNGTNTIDPSDGASGQTSRSIQARSMIEFIAYSTTADFTYIITPQVEINDSDLNASGEFLIYDASVGANHLITAPYTMPSADGTPNQIISTDGNGSLSFIDQPSGTAPDVVTDSSGTNTTISTYTGIEEVHLISNGANNVTITLPSASTVGEGYKYQIKRLGAGNVTVTPASGYIDASGTTTFSLASQFDSITLVSDSSNYYII